MIRALIKKEMREHRVSLILLWALGGLVFFAQIGTEVEAGTAGSYFAIFRGFLNSVQIILSYIICERLINKEYRAKTQLFLEALPMRRVDMLGIKYAFALAQVLVMVSLGLLVCAMLGWEDEGITRSFLGVISLRALAASFFWFSFFFAMSMLGKFRIGLYIMIILVVISLDMDTGFEWSKFPPMDLLNDRFAFERDVVPWHSLGWTVAISLALSALGFGLGLVREGSVASLLAEKMNHREKIFVSIAVISTLMVVVFISAKNEKEPVGFEEYAEASGEGFTVKFDLHTCVYHENAEYWAHWHQQGMDDLQQYLQLPALPNTFLMGRRDFDTDKFERSQLSELEGMVLRANYNTQDFEWGKYSSWLTREVLLNTSHERAGIEARRWVLDGFALYWHMEDGTVAGAGRDSLYLLRAAYGVPAQITEKDLDQWLTFRSQVGDDVSDAVAWSGLKTLAGLAGEKPMSDFLKAVLSDPIPQDIRAVFHQINHPVMAEMVRHAMVEPDTFLAVWNRDLDRARNDYAGVLREIPRVEGLVETTALSGRNRTISYAPAENVFPPDQPFEFKYQVLSLMVNQADPQRVKSVEQYHLEGTIYDLPEIFQVGDRMVSTFACFSSALSCEVISGWKILKVEQ